MLDYLNKENIPVTIISAGFGDLVTEILKIHNVYFPNLHIISNFFKFDENGNMIGFQDDIIHAYNKNKIDFYARLNKRHTERTLLSEKQKRSNVILMGDSLGDPCMADGMKDVSAILKVGFLNYGMDTQEQQSRINSYLDVYDIVCIDDHSVDVVNFILRGILTCTDPHAEIKIK